MPELVGVILVAVHIGLLGCWLGAMLYSLLVVQPRAGRFFAGHDDAHEAFLVTLGAGNRRPVLAIIAVLFVTGATIAATNEVHVALVAAEGALLGLAAAIFARVSWRLWPRRVFALPAERPAHRAALRGHAVALMMTVGASLVLAIGALMVAP